MCSDDSSITCRKVSGKPCSHFGPCPDDDMGLLSGENPRSCHHNNRADTCIACRELAALRVERDMMEAGWKAETERHSDTLIEVERMRPVVQLVDEHAGDMALPTDLLIALEAYREATTDGS